MLQVRVCEVHVAGETTEEVWYAVTEAPLAMLPLQGRGQEAGGFTETVTDCSGDVPPGPVHWKVKVALVVSAPVEALPETALVPLHAPLAVQLVAPVELQVSVAEPP